MKLYNLKKLGFLCSWLNLAFFIFQKNGLNTVLTVQSMIPKSIIEKSVSHCPNCIKGICKIRKHHKMIHDGSVYKPLKKHLQSVSYWEKSGMFWSGAATPARVPDFKLRLNPSNKDIFHTVFQSIVRFSIAILQYFSI